MVNPTENNVQKKNINLYLIAMCLHSWLHVWTTWHMFLMACLENHINRSDYIGLGIDNHKKNSLCLAERKARLFDRLRRTLCVSVHGTETKSLPALS